MEKWNSLSLLLLLTLSSLLLSVAVAEEADKSEEAPEDEPYLGTLDYILLVACGLGGAYYFFVLREKKEEPKMPSYVIQPTAAPTASASADRGFITKMKNSKRRLVVFYGSQTGTAEEFAGRLAKEGARYGLKGIVADPEECEMEDLGKIKELEDELEGPTLAVFMMATYGEGDPTDNAQEFFDWLKGEPEGMEGRRKKRLLRALIRKKKSRKHSVVYFVSVYYGEQCDLLPLNKCTPLTGDPFVEVTLTKNIIFLIFRKKDILNSLRTCASRKQQ